MALRSWSWLERPPLGLHANGLTWPAAVDKALLGEVRFDTTEEIIVCRKVEICG
jgi:hypothetical protein